MNGLSGLLDGRTVQHAIQVYFYIDIFKRQLRRGGTQRV